MIRLLLLLTMLSGCARAYTEIGTVRTKVDWKCLKEKSSTGFGVSGSGNAVLATTSTCVVSRCMETEIRIGRYAWQDEVLSETVLEDERCLD